MAALLLAQCVHYAAEPAAVCWTNLIQQRRAFGREVDPHDPTVLGIHSPLEQSLLLQAIQETADGSPGHAGVFRQFRSRRRRRLTLVYQQQQIEPALACSE